MIDVAALLQSDYRPELGKLVLHPIALHASPPLLTFGTEVMQSVPHHELHDAQGRRLYLTADERHAFIAATATAAATPAAAPTAGTSPTDVGETPPLA